MQPHLNQVFLQEIQEIALVDFNNLLTMEISSTATTLRPWRPMRFTFGASGKHVVFPDHDGAHLGSLANNCFSFH